MSSNMNDRRGGAWRRVTAILLALAIGWFATAHAAAVDPPFANPATCGNPEVIFLGQSEALDKATFDGIQVAELSGITYDREMNVYEVQADRVGAGIASRYFTVTADASWAGLGGVAVTDVTVLQKADGTASTGSDFDGEGIAVSHGGELLIASEGRSAAGVPLFQTQIRRYTPDGVLLGTLPVPTRFLVAPDGAGVSNLTFESMAISPDGRMAFTANETPLASDGATADRRGRIRIVQYENRGPEGFVPIREAFYLTEPARNPTGTLEVGVVEIIALSGDDLLVLERGFIATAGNTVRIFAVSVAGAADVSAEPTLASPGLVPLAKSLVVDLVTCPAGGATSPPGAIQPNPVLDNFEGMTLGPATAAGLRVLLMVSDDNGAANQRTRIVALAIPIPALVGED
jgi:hypothetical protein